MTFAAAAMAAMVLTACSPEDAGSAGPTSPSPAPHVPSPSPEDATAKAERAALDAYRGMWAAFERASEPPEANPDDERLAMYATGDALRVLVNGLASMRDDGLVGAGEVALSPVVVELLPESDPTRARIEDCADTSNSSLVRADGGPYDDEPGGPRLVLADLEETGDGVWKVAGFAVKQVGSCS